MDPCYYRPYPRPSNDLSQIIFIKNGDTTKIIKEFNYVIAYYGDITYNVDDFTSVELNYKYNYSSDDGDSGYYLYFSFKGYRTGDYTSNITLSFQQSYYSKDYLSDKSQIKITKYEDVWGLVEGNFADNFIYENDSISDTIFISCRFSALRWCDGGNRMGVFTFK
jgi:hypothetical protein